MDIKVGEYVRTKLGKIDKVKNNNYYMQQYIECEKGLYLRVNITKHSANITVLIEVGDCVNGRLVLAVDYKRQNICLLIPFTDTKASTNIMWYGYEEIKAILTHEQFEANAYKVKGE